MNKHLNYVIGWIVFFILTISCSFTQPNIKQDLPDRKNPAPVVVKKYRKAELLHSFDSLNNLYGKNKILPKGFEIQALLALSHYPELRSAHINFIVEKAMIPLSSRPRFFSTFSRKVNWEYKVVISSDTSGPMADILLVNLPFNAQVGIIGHELAHTVYYQDKSFFRIIGIGIRYPFKKYRARFEKDTDRRAVKYGLGWQLLDYAKYVRKVAKVREKETGYMDEFYLTPDEILNEINKSDLYK